LHASINIKIDMSARKYNLPSTNSLIAFEAVARRQSFARAAEELNTSQPAISRHIKNLEIRFGTELFDRSGSRIRLTRAGEGFFMQVVQMLDGLQGAVEDLASTGREVRLVCSHTVSHLLVMPRYAKLRRVLGPQVELRLLTAEYNLVRAAIDTGSDIVFEYSSRPPERQHVIVCPEEIKPVGTRAVVDQAIAALAGNKPPPPLLSLQRENHGWLTWTDWQAARPGAADWSISETHDNYVYLLEAAVAGNGLALGWRGFVNSYVERGDLVELPGDWFSKGTHIYARLTRHGTQNNAARKCLRLLSGLLSVD
jgi:LysR family glycine cleavage system transcriptional activator